MSERPCYVVFAGVNGAGKSTLYRTGLWRTNDMPRTMERVNPDEIAKSESLSAFEAGKRARSSIERLLRERRSFNQETTLSGHLALRNIKRAHEGGYRVVVYYIGLQSPDLALQRIAHRVSTGGHDIAEADVRRRFETSLVNFSRALDYCDEATAFDNTRGFTSLAQWSSGAICWWGNPREDGPWLVDAMGNPEWRRD